MVSGVRVVSVVDAIADNLRDSVLDGSLSPGTALTETDVAGRYDVARGHPQKPMSWAELGDKFRDCADLVLPRKNAEAAIQLISRLEELRSLKPLLRALSGDQDNHDRKTKAAKPGSKKWSRTLKR